MPINFQVTRYPVVKATWYRFKPDGDPDGNSTTSWISEPYTSYKDTSAKNPDWRSDIKEGRCATTPAYGAKRSWVFKPMYFEAANQGGYTWHGYHAQSDTSVPLTSVALGSEASNEALSRYLKRTQETLQKFQGLTFLGELSEALRMIKRPAASLRKEFGRHVEKTRRKTRHLRPGSPSFGKAVAGSWLEAVFGWLPLFNDIDQGMAALAEWNPPTRRLIPVTCRVIKKDKVLFADQVLGAGPIHYRHKLWDEHMCTARYRGRVLWDPHYAHDFRYWGLNPREILPTVWELIPYSFAVDYFTNIGDIISSWSFGTAHIAWTDRTLFRQVVRSNESTYDTWHLSSSPGVGDDKLPSNVYFRAPKVNLSVRYFERGQVFDLDVPDFTWDIPGVGSRKWLNLAALSVAKLR